MWFGNYVLPENRLAPSGYSVKTDIELCYDLRMAIARDEKLNPEEAAAKREAEMECEFGPRWWTRAHP